MSEPTYQDVLDELLEEKERLNVSYMETDDDEFALQLQDDLDILSTTINRMEAAYCTLAVRVR